MADEDEAKGISRRDLLKGAGYGAVGAALGAAGAGAANVLGSLQPPRRFQEDWKGSLPLLDGDGFLVLNGARTTIAEVEAKAPPGGQTGFLFLWNDAYWRSVSPALIVRDADGEWRASSLRCTHASCLVGWREQLGTFAQVWYCPCHHGTYDGRTGHVVSGPPPAGLQQFDVTFDGDVVRLVKRS